MSVKPVEFKKDEFRASVENLKRNLPSLIEHAKLVAKIRRASYDALIAEKFTPEQALELCKGSAANS